MLDERRDFLRMAWAAGAKAIFSPKVIRAVEASARRLSVSTPGAAGIDFGGLR
jgi:hypothetical protein